MPKLSKMLLKLGFSKYTTPLDLNMGYYHIQLSKYARNLCTIILPCVKYWHKCLPMGVSNSPEKFQEKMNELFQGLGFIRASIDNILILTRDNWNYHLTKLELTLNELKKVSLNVISKSLSLA